MTDTNNTDGAALLPVTAADTELVAAIFEEFGALSGLTIEHIRRGLYNGDKVMQMVASHRQPHSLYQGRCIMTSKDTALPQAARAASLRPQPASPFSQSGIANADDDEQPGDYLRDQLLNIAEICKAKALYVEAASLRSIAAIVSEQLGKGPIGFGEYLKPHETPLERLEREVADNQALMELLAKERSKSAKMEAALRNVRSRFVNAGNSSPLWVDMAEDMDAYAFEGLEGCKDA